MPIQKITSTNSSTPVVLSPINQKLIEESMKTTPKTNELTLSKLNSDEKTETKAKEKKPLSKKTKILIMTGAALAIAAIAVIFAIRKKPNLEKAVNNFTNALDEFTEALSDAFDSFDK